MSSSTTDRKYINIPNNIDADGIDTHLLSYHDYLQNQRDISKIFIQDLFDSTKTKKLGTSLLHTMCSDKQLFDKLIKFFKDDSKGEFRFLTPYHGDIVTTKFYKSEIVTALKTAIEKYSVTDDTTDFQTAYNTFSQYTSLDRFQRGLMKNSRPYIVALDSHKRVFWPQSMFQKLTLPQQEWLEFIDTPDAMVGKATKPEFAHALVRYAEQNQVLQKYVFPDEIVRRYNDIKAFKLIDHEALNQFYTTDNIFLDDTHINRNLEHLIMDSIPEEYSQLEKAIYVYIKLCKTLSYDEEFYAVEQRGTVARKHENIERIKQISPTNNEVVCYEFNAIYGKLLSSLKINHHIYSKGSINRFGGGHANLGFRCGKFLITADSVSAILNGDLPRAKVNNELVGLICTNKNPDTKLEFDSIVKMVQLDIISREMAAHTEALFKEKTEEDEFNEALVRYHSRIESETMPVQINTKINMMFSQIENANMHGMDAYGYLLTLRKTYFSEAEQNRNLNITLLRENTPESIEEGTDEGAKVAALITYSKELYDSDYPKEYYLYRESRGVSEISQESFINAFNNGIFQFIGQHRTVPGINFSYEGVKLYAEQPTPEEQ